MATNNTSKNSKYFECIHCDFKCSKKGDYNRHILTPKHKKTTESTKIDINTSIFICEKCNKNYKDRSGLWRHKNKCSSLNTPTEEVNNNELNEKEIILKLLNQNGQLQNQIIELCKKVGNNNNINSNNKTKFNLNFFLNETCKDAMNITDFVSSIKLQLTDLENLGKNGYVNGISNIIVKNLNALEINKRPVHCSDLKREIMYVKDENRWEKEKEKLENAIKKVSYKNVLKILEWQKEHPGCEYSCNKENDKYLQIVNESMSALTEEEKMKNINKIITRIAKEVVIDKDAIIENE
jgi:hypothetical protein